MLEIRRAEETEFQNVRTFYYSLIDMTQEAEYKPQWEKGVYPADDYLLDSIRSRTLYIGVSNGEIAAAMIVNHESNEGYLKAKWEVDASESEVMVVHALGVMPTHSGKGFGKRMVKEAIDLARGQNQKAVRLDVLGGNLPAEKLYTGMGFQYRETLQMFYEDTGWTDFLLYEYPL